MFVAIRDTEYLEIIALLLLFIQELENKDNCY